MGRACGQTNCWLQKHIVQYLFFYHPLMQTGGLPCGRRREAVAFYTRRVPFHVGNNSEYNPTILISEELRYTGTKVV